MAEVFLSLSASDRRDALGVAADRSGRPAHLLEKDVWVVWALQTIFGSDLGAHLVFKGGTSLSKAYGIIHRFSEDVDLTYDIRTIAPDLVKGNGDALPATRSEEKRWSKVVRQRLPEWVAGTVQPILSDAIAAQGISAATRVEGEKLFIDYEATFAGSGYVAPSVMLEFGARSTGEPASPREVVALVPEGDDLAIVLRGDLGAILRFAAGKKDPDFLKEAEALDNLLGNWGTLRKPGRKKAKTSALGATEVSQLSLVAGAGFTDCFNMFRATIQPCPAKAA